nr:MAG TPA: hypothetical protein [Caudoviricetes sp.]
MTLFKDSHVNVYEKSYFYVLMVNNSTVRRSL